ncbi:MAG: CAP domain-containing protein [Bacteroidota bacterium]
MNVFIIYLFILFPSYNEGLSSEVCLSKEEVKLVNIINKYRKSKRLKAIPVSKKLTLVAQLHAKDLAENYDFNPKGKCNPHSWSNQGSWTSCCYTNDHKEAECMWNKPKEIAEYESHGYEIAYYSSAGATAEEGLRGWKKSSGHNPLLINAGMWERVKWKAIGVGIYKEYAVVWFGQLEDEEQPCNN